VNSEQDISQSICGVVLNDYYYCCNFCGIIVVEDEKTRVRHYFGGISRYLNDSSTSLTMAFKNRQLLVRNF
jgi:hypothetical protein